MSIDDFIAQINSNPYSLQFRDVIEIIDTHYTFTPTPFRNGKLRNLAGENSGSCKLFSFAQQLSLTKEQTLWCFGDYYRVDVLQNPEAENHLNIRNFIQYGWSGVEFEGKALAPKIDSLFG